MSPLEAKPEHEAARLAELARRRAPGAPPNTKLSNRLDDTDVSASESEGEAEERPQQTQPDWSAARKERAEARYNACMCIAPERAARSALSHARQTCFRCACWASH